MIFIDFVNCESWMRIAFGKRLVQFVSQIVAVSLTNNVRLESQKNRTIISTSSASYGLVKLQYKHATMHGINVQCQIGSMSAVSHPNHHFRLSTTRTEVKA